MDVDTKDVKVEEEEDAPVNKEIKTGERNDNMNSGFAKHIEKEKVIEVFHCVAWPALSAAGWTKVRHGIPTDALSKFCTENGEGKFSTMFS